MHEGTPHQVNQYQDMWGCSQAGGVWDFATNKCNFPKTQADPAGFTGTVDSLGFEELLPSGTWVGKCSVVPASGIGYSTEEDCIAADGEWTTGFGKYFDPYDVKREKELGIGAGIDIGQLGETWDYESGKLKKGWGAAIKGLGVQAGEQRRKSGLSYSETAETNLGRGMQVGKQAYQQAMEAGQFKLAQSTTDIYQKLATDIYEERESWKDEQRRTLDVLLQMDTGDTGEQEVLGCTYAAADNYNENATRDDFSCVYS